MLFSEEKYLLVRAFEQIVTFKHPNIIGYYAIDQKENQDELIVITELIYSGSLGEFMSMVKIFKLQIIISFLKKVLNSVEYLHS